MCINGLRRTYVHLVTPLFILGLFRLSISLIALARDCFTERLVTLINVIAKHNQRVYGKQDFPYVS